MKEETKLKISLAMKGKNKGRKFTKEHKMKLSKKRKEVLLNPENHPNWKGENASYRSIHAFIVRRFGKAQICENCKKTNKIQWANFNHKYSRDIKQWKQLCAKCHGEHDKLLKLRKHKKLYVSK